MTEARASVELAPQGKQGTGQRAPEGTYTGARAQSKGTRQASVIASGIIVGASILAVIVGAFSISFEATREVAIASRVWAGVAWLMPVALDGAIVTACVVVLAMKYFRRSVGYPLTVVVIGTLLSVAINGLHAVGTVGAPLHLSTPLRFGVSAIPPAMMALVVHMAMTLLEARRDARAEELAADRAAEAAEAQHAAELARLAAETARLEAEAQRNATHATHATPEPQVAPEAPQVQPAASAPAVAPTPRASRAPRRPVAAPVAARGTDELALRREADEDAYVALVTWWRSAEGKATIEARRGNDGFPNRAEAKAVCHVGGAVADRLKNRIREEFSADTYVPEEMAQ